MRPDDTNTTADAPKPTMPPFTALGSRFIRRTALGSLVTTALVALTAAVYWSPIWAARYLFTGFWALGFFALTPWILKAFMFDGRTLRGLALLGLKFIWMGLLLAVCFAWPLAEGREVIDGTAIVAGITTPLFVVTLRAIGAMTHQNNSAPDKGSSPDPASQKSTESKA